MSMDHYEGEILIGKVEEVKPYALFLSFEDGAKGLLHISELSDSFIRDIEKYGTKGDEMKVVVLSVDNNNGFLRVSYKKISKEERYTSHNEKKKITPLAGEHDFDPLKEKLDEWIEVTLKRKEDKEHD